METNRKLRTMLGSALSLLILILTLSCSENTFDEQVDVTADAVSEAVPEGTAPAEKKKNETVTVNTLVNLDPFLFQLPESIAVDRHGNIYLSISPLREIWKLDPLGNFQEVVADFDLEEDLFGVNGIRFDNKENLYVAISSALPEMNGVWKIDESGEKERLTGTGDILLPNDVAILPNGTIYVTDSAMGAVWRILPGGEAEVWLQDEALEGNRAFGLPVPIGANGIVVSRRSGEKSTGSVLVAVTEKGQLVSIPVLPDGSAGEAEILVSDPDVLFGLDGITLDPQGNVYGAVNYRHTIVRIDRESNEVEALVSGSPLDFPTSVTFGSGKENHSLFISNFSVLHFLSPEPMPENANPGVIIVRLTK